MRKAYKNIIALSVVLIAGLNIIVPAIAQEPFTAIAVGGLGGASGAGLFGSMASMSGVNINYTTTDPMDAMWNVLNPDHVYFSGEKHEADPQTYPEDIYDYIDVDIGDWLEAQQNFISEFCQNYNVTDNSSGQTTSELSIQGIPININRPSALYPMRSDVLGTITFTSSNYTGEVSFQNVRIVVTEESGRQRFSAYLNGSLSSSFLANKQTGTFCLIYIKENTNKIYGGLIQDTKLNGDYAPIVKTGNMGSGSTSSTSWTSGNVNTSVFDGWSSAKVKIPHSISQLQTGWTLTDFLNELNRIWSGAGEDQIIIEDGYQPTPPPPIPDTKLGEVPFDDWVDLWGQGIYQQQENQSDALDFIGSNGEDAVEELQSIDSNLDGLNETAESIDTNIGTGIGLLGGIKSAAESGVEFLEGIAEHVEELVQEIVEGTETLIAGILNQIPAVFGVIFGPIKQASSIWHYVVEWIQSISAPMSWMWTMASGTSYNMVLPVYASLAGAVVLAFYKRFGK